MNKIALTALVAVCYISTGYAQFSSKQITAQSSALTNIVMLNTQTGFAAGTDGIFKTQAYLLNVSSKGKDRAEKLMISKSN